MNQFNYFILKKKKSVILIHYLLNKNLKIQYITISLKHVGERANHWIPEVEVEVDVGCVGCHAGASGKQVIPSTELHLKHIIYTIIK